MDDLKVITLATLVWEETLPSESLRLDCVAMESALRAQDIDATP
jgi:hypothetical protein